MAMPAGSANTLVNFAVYERDTTTARWNIQKGFRIFRKLNQRTLLN
jgi:hypothetical protein